MKAIAQITELERVLMHREEITRSKAFEKISEMRQEVAEGADPEEVLYENGLEPDYIFDLLEDLR